MRDAWFLKTICHPAITLYVTHRQLTSSNNYNYYNKLEDTVMIILIFPFCPYTQRWEQICAFLDQNCLFRI